MLSNVQHWFLISLINFFYKIMHEDKSNKLHLTSVFSNTLVREYGIRLGNKQWVLYYYYYRTILLTKCCGSEKGLDVENQPNLAPWTLQFLLSKLAASEFSTRV